MDFLELERPPPEKQALKPDSPKPTASLLEAADSLQRATEHLRIYSSGEIDFVVDPADQAPRSAQQPTQLEPPNEVAPSGTSNGFPAPDQPPGNQPSSNDGQPAGAEPAVPGQTLPPLEPQRSPSVESHHRHHSSHHHRSRHRHKSHHRSSHYHQRGSRSISPSRSRSKDRSASTRHRHSRHHRHRHRSSRRSPSRGRSRSRDHYKHKRHSNRSRSRSRSRSRGGRDRHRSHRGNEDRVHKRRSSSQSPRKHHRHSSHHHSSYHRSRRRSHSRSNSPSPPRRNPSHNQEERPGGSHKPTSSHGLEQEAPQQSVVMRDVSHTDHQYGLTGELTRHVEGSVEDLHRTESGRGLVVRLKIKPPLGSSGSDEDQGLCLSEAQHAQQGGGSFPEGVVAAQVLPPGLVAARLSFADELDVDLLQAVSTVGRETTIPSPMVLSPRKVIHEKTLVTIASPMAPSPRALQQQPSMEEMIEAPMSAPMSPMGARVLGPLIFGSARAQGMRPYMEDRHTVIESYMPQASTGHELKDEVPRSFAGVYDGHNGALAADHAAERLHTILAAESALRTCTGEGPPATLVQEEERMAAALVHSFEATDKEILTRCRVEGVRGGATGVVIVRIGDMLYAAHCGDSRAVMCRCGEPLRLTEDHKPNLPRERKRVEGLGGRVDFARCWRVIVDPGNGRPASGLAVSRAFGDPDFKEPLHLVTASPDVMSEKLLPGDTFVILASDGLWDVLSDKEACDLVTSHLHRALSSVSPSPLAMLANTAAEVLVEASLKAGTMDNVTALVALLEWN